MNGLVMIVCGLLWPEGVSVDEQVVRVFDERSRHWSESISNRLTAELVLGGGEQLDEEADGGDELPLLFIDWLCCRMPCVKWPFELTSLVGWVSLEVAEVT